MAKAISVIHNFWSVSLLLKIDRFLECAADFAAEYQAMKGILELIQGSPEPTRNTVDLTWTSHG